MYEEIHEFPDPKYMFDLKTKELTTPEKFVAWRSENHPDFQITVDSILIAKMKILLAIILTEVS